MYGATKKKKERKITYISSSTLVLYVVLLQPYQRHVEKHQERILDLLDNLDDILVSQDVLLADLLGVVLR